MSEQTLAQSKFNLHEVLNSPRWAILLIVLLWGVCYLPGLSERDLRLEEGRRATPAAEMLATGDFIVPRLYTEPYLNKPPMFFWMVAGVGGIRGDVDELAVRIPSVASVLLGALMLLFFARKQLPLHVRTIAALLFMATPIVLDKGTLGEIEAVLAFVTFGGVCMLWNGFDHECGRFKLSAWIAAGVMLAIATLCKGPGGLVQFYAMVIPFLLVSGKGRWKQIFSLGHLLMLIIAIGPAVLWAMSMMNRAGIPLESAVSIWGEQTGTKANRSIFTQDHYVWFPPRAVSMLLPWVVFPLLALIPKVRRDFMKALCEVTRGSQDSAEMQERNLRDLWHYLVWGLPVMIAIFWIWPRGEPRYLAMAAFPVAVLAAMMISALAVGIKNSAFHKHVTNFGRGTPLGVMVCAAGGVAAAIFISKDNVASVSVLAGMCIAIAIAALLLFRTSEISNSAALVAIGVAMVALCARGLVAASLFPKIAQRDSTWLLHQQVDQIVPTDLPLYTTRIFSNLKANDYYNIQFYLRARTAAGRRDPMPLKTFAELPAEKTAIVILGEKEWDGLVTVAPHAVKLGTLSTPRGPAPLIVARVPN